MPLLIWPSGQRHDAGGRFGGWDDAAYGGVVTAMCEVPSKTSPTTHTITVWFPPAIVYGDRVRWQPWISTALRLALVAVGSSLVSAPATTPAAARPPWTPPIRLDRVGAIDAAVSGNSAVWLRPSGKTTAALVWWSTSSGAAVATNARLRRNPTRLTFGTDAAGQPAVIVEYAKAAARIYGLRPSVAPGPAGAPVSTVAVVPDRNGQVLPVAAIAGDRPHHFGLRDGRISFARRHGVGRRARDAIWLGTASSPDAQLISRRPREPRNRSVVDTALGTDTRVAYTAIVTQGSHRGEGLSWRISPERHRPRSLGLFYGTGEGGSMAGSRITVRGDGVSAAISVYGSLGDGNGDYLFGFGTGRIWDHYSGEPAWRQPGDADWRAVERGKRPLPTSSLPLDDGGFVGYVANEPFLGYDEDSIGNRLACPRGTTKPRCAVWWRPLTGPAPAAPRGST